MNVLVQDFFEVIYQGATVFILNWKKTYTLEVNLTIKKKDGS